MYLGNNYLRAFHGEWGLVWPRLQIVLLCPSWVSTVCQEGLLSPRAKLLVPSLACPQLLLLTFLLLQDPLLLLRTDGVPLRIGDVPRGGCPVCCLLGLAVVGRQARSLPPLSSPHSIIQSG